MKRMTYKEQCAYLMNVVDFYLNDRFIDDEDAFIMKMNVAARLKILEEYY